MQRALLIISFLFISSCGTGASGELPAVSTGCSPGTAMIAVADGYLETLCGCAEATPVFSGPGTRLTCTITADTVVMIHFFGVTLKHQIVPTGVSTFPASGLNDPGDSSTVQVHVIRLTTPGTYSFQDALNNALAGDLIVI